MPVFYYGHYMSDIKTIIHDCQSEILSYRRHLHSIPEQSFAEQKSSAYVACVLRQLGLEVTSGIANHGVFGDRIYTPTGKTLLLRSELDGLPIQEQTGLPFASRHEGVMHACGHDGNMAMVLGAALVLSKVEKQLRGRVRFLFQPSEERLNGAKSMIEAGAMDHPPADFTLACHLWPDLPEGFVGVRPGPVMAATDWFEIKIVGYGGHAGMPHLCTDALEIGTQIVAALQRIVSRQINPLLPAVLTIGKFNSGTTHNIIPAEAKIFGTTRAYNDETWRSWPEKIETVVAGICKAMGARYEMDYRVGCPITKNDPWLTEQVHKYAAAAVGEENVTIPDLKMGGEDVSYFFEKSRGCFFFLGVGKENCAPLHNSAFDFSEDTLLTGVEIYCRAAMEILGEKNNQRAE